MLAFLIPSRSNHDWNKKESFIAQTIKSIAETKDTPCKIFLGHDQDDIFYKNDVNTTHLRELASSFDICVQFYEMDIERGHLTKMWNFLAQKACDENFDYYYMCGDDILFSEKGWMSKCISKLHTEGNIGMTSPKDLGNLRLLTQCLVHKTHLIIFGFLLPEELRNWHCDDWMNLIYDPLRIDPIFTCRNISSLKGGERYDIIDGARVLQNLVLRDKTRILEFKQKNLTPH